MTHAQGSLRACPSTCTAPASASSSCKQLSIEPAAFAAFVAAGNYGPASESSGQGGSRGVGVSRRLVFGEAGSCHAEVAEQQRDMLPVLPPSSTPKATDGSPVGSSAAGHPAAAAALPCPPRCSRPRPYWQRLLSPERRQVSQVLDPFQAKSISGGRQCRSLKIGCEHLSE